MRILRLLGLLVIFAAIAVAAVDYIEYRNSGGPMFRSAMEWWMMTAPSTLDGFQGFVENAFGPDVWNPTLTTVLAWPAAIVLGLKSMAIFLIVVVLRIF